jgi:hypothetical protein
LRKTHQTTKPNTKSDLIEQLQKRRTVIASNNKEEQEEKDITEWE